MDEAEGIDCLGRHMSISTERMVSEVACVHILRWERPSHWTRELDFSRLCGVWCLHLDIRCVCVCQANTCGSLLIVVHNAACNADTLSMSLLVDVARVATKMTTQEKTTVATARCFG